MTPHGAIESMLARREELQPEEEAELTSHLAHCSKCREAAATYGLQDRVLREFAQDQGSCSVYEAVIGRVDELERGRDLARASRLRRRLVPLLAALTVAAAALVGAKILTLNLPPTAGEGSPVPAPVAGRLSACYAPEEGWSVNAPCRIIDSPRPFLKDGVVTLKWSVDWVHSHLDVRHYVVSDGLQFPIKFSQHTKDVYFSKMAFDPRTRAGLYAVGKAKT